MLPQIDDVWNDEQEKHTWAKVMFAFLLLGFIQGVKITAAKALPDELLTWQKRASYQVKSLQYAALTVGTTKEALKVEIDAAIAEGESVKQLAARINALYGESMGYRSVRIARTQLTETINDGVQTTLEADGQKFKEWSTVIDGREREAHHDADGEVVAIDAPFTVGGETGMFPGDNSFSPENSINCRCTILAAGSPDDRKLYLGRLFLRTHTALEKRYVVSLRRAFIAQRDRVLSRLPT